MTHLANYRKQNRLLILYDYKFGSNAADAVRRINEAWGDRMVGESTVSERFHEFKAGNEELTAGPRFGRPTELDEKT
ncbi:hypothetical protein KIN20_028135 [Parelaphostrongylus tenuis]|uniref:Mos1 transposase HTH domain-containing protein n=1 Tax=Parelaphostrongylus tenuis TaxID=148309 RepID=A0AAD5R103_PARTN|nr:hypothetical protein KIN20_028133 [Parelaphostrongylus tenuis]KAJ1367261.1 hypothetical protein KIN20_028135 [Parelaphostrongylus tenuis]